MIRPAAAVLAVLVAAIAVPACSKKKPTPAPAQPAAQQPVVPPPSVQPKVDPPPPPLTADQRVQIEKDYTEARKYAAEATALRVQGEKIEKEKGREAANDTLVEARKLYQKAIGLTEKWVDPDFARIVTQQQVDRLIELQPYLQERERWLKANASMGTKLNVR